MKFGALHKAYFDADDGAYSIVTEDERKKGQITLTETDGEAQIAIEHYSSCGQTIPRKATKDQRLPVKTCTVDNQWENADIAINYPKSQGNELRIYRSEKSHFAYQAGDIWYTFVKDAHLHIGSMPEKEWRRQGIDDYDDSKFQSNVDSDSSKPIVTIVSGKKYSRSPKLSREALANANFQCEYDPSTHLFISRATGHPYLEAHHLVPFYATSQLGGHSLDLPENIVALAPHWHRAIHSAEEPIVHHILKKLTISHPAIMERCKITLDDLMHIYGCGEITRHPS